MKDTILNMLRNPDNRKWFVIGIVVAILIGVAAINSAEARPPHNHDPDVTYIFNVTEITEKATGIASAMALGQCQYDYTHSLQGCVGLGFNDGTQAISFGLAKRSDEVLISGGLALEESGNVSAAAAINWKF
jgi:hypothetical protein